MNVYSELTEINELMEKSGYMSDDILDLYKQYPKQCKSLLIELCEINKELEDLEKEFEKIQNDIY
jgi:SAM-dependent MidA family methyltransferase